MIVGNIQDGLATIGPLQLNQSLPLFIHAAGLMDIFQRVTLAGPRIVIAPNNDQRLDLLYEPFCELEALFCRPLRDLADFYFLSGTGVPLRPPDSIIFLAPPNFCIRAAWSFLASASIFSGSTISFRIPRN